MSNPTFGHAAHSLTILEQQDLSGDDFNTLHQGYLADLARAVKRGTIPARDAFQKFLGLVIELKIWKTVKLGLKKTSAEYEASIDQPEEKKRLGDYARQILAKITVSQMVVEMDLCVKTVAELGFKGNARYDEICKRIIEIGGALCPAEVGPALREQYQDQPVGEWLLIAMEAMADADGDLRVFAVGHVSDGRWLCTYDGSPARLFRPDARVVFVVPRKLES